MFFIPFFRTKNNRTRELFFIIFCSSSTIQKNNIIADPSLIYSSEDHGRTPRMALNDGLAPTEASLNVSSKDSAIYASTRTYYDAILRELCGKIEGASYYSGSSSSWFLRGALEKCVRERRSKLTSGQDDFSPRGLTDALLEKLLLEEDCDDPLAKQVEKKDEDENRTEQEDDKKRGNYLTVAKALVCDSTKYLPAIAASLSHLVSSTEISPNSLSPRVVESSVRKASSNSKRIKVMSAIVFTREFLQLWVHTIIDDSTPENIYDQLCGDLFRVFQQQHQLRNSDDPLNLPIHALYCLVQEDSWHCSHFKDNATTPKSLSPPSTQATLRRASVLLRFLSRGETCVALDSESKQRIFSTSGAMEWFLEVLKCEGYPARHQRQRRETSFGLFDLLLAEFKVANDHLSKISTSVEWLFYPNIVETILLYFKETIRELVEDWKRHLMAVPISQQGALTTKALPEILQSYRNNDIVCGKNRKTLDCATRYIRFVARLSLRVCPSSSLDIVKEASKGCAQGGKDLLIMMLRLQESPLQRLRLVRLLIDEFGNSGISLSIPVEKDNVDIASRKEWLSSPGILAPILQTISRDPFLLSSDSTHRFLNTYGDPSWNTAFSNKPKPREAPQAMPIEAYQASLLGGTRTAAMASAPSESLSPILRWFSDATGRFQSGEFPGSKGGGGEKLLLMLRKKMEDRLLGNSSLRDDQYNLFDEGDRATGKPTSKQNDQYSLFDG